MKGKIRYQQWFAAFQLFFIIGLLLSGLLIYWLFSPGIYFFKMLGITNNNHQIAADIPFYVIIRNYLPDILWVIALNQTAVLLRDKIGKINFYLLIVVPFLTEILQNFQFFPGYFDWYDMAIYFLVYIFFFKLKFNYMNAKVYSTVGFFIIVLNIAMIIASAPAGKTTKTVEKPGWYGISTGWNNWISDIDGQVGYKLYASSPRGRCAPSGSWTGATSIVSGNLPPGLYFESHNITGIPTERGHWIVKLKLSSIQCNGSYYKDFEQELRFHITGTGKVNN